MLQMLENTSKVQDQRLVMKIGAIELDQPFALAPMAGMTDTAFRRLVKRHGGCGLVVSEMVSSEGLVRGIDRTLAYAEYTEEERPVSIQIFGGDPETMASAAQVVEGMGADIIDVNMGCPVPKIAKHNAGCSLMREPEHAARVVRSMAKAVSVPVTVKMRAGWDESAINAPLVAEMMQDAGAAAVAVHGRTAAQSYRGQSDWELINQVADGVGIPVFGSGDCVTPEQVVNRISTSKVAGVLVGRGALRNPWIFRQALAIFRGEACVEINAAERGQFLLDYIELLLREECGEMPGFRHTVPTKQKVPSKIPQGTRSQRSRQRFVVNKLRALGSWFTKGIHGGSQLRVEINRAESVNELREVVDRFFFQGPSRETKSLPDYEWSTNQ